jgi:hypothetical protein
LKTCQLTSGGGEFGEVGGCDSMCDGCEGLVRGECRSGNFCPVHPGKTHQVTAAIDDGDRDQGAHSHRLLNRQPAEFTREDEGYLATIVTVVWYRHVFTVEASEGSARRRNRVRCRNFVLATTSP